MLPNYEYKLAEIREHIHSVFQDAILISTEFMEAFDKNENLFFSAGCSKNKELINITDSIDTKIIQTIALFTPEANELRGLIVYLKMTNEIDRIINSIAKYCRNFDIQVLERYDLSSLNNSVLQLHKTILIILQHLALFFDDNAECDANDIYRKVLIEESINDDIFDIIEKDLLLSILNDSENASDYIKILSTLRNLERIADRGVSIASLLLYAQEGGEFHLRHP